MMSTSWASRRRWWSLKNAAKVPGFPLARGEVQPANPVRSHPLSAEGLSLLLGNLDAPFCLLHLFSHPLQGDKNHGFEVLYHCVKQGPVATKELADFIRER